MKPSDIRILAVDDDPLMLETISELFRSYQFQVDTAGSGNKAWELLGKHTYDLVISDIRMPDGDGFELVKKIKARNSSKPKVLFISGISDLLNEEIYHLGVEGVFAKPFDATAVKRAIQTCLLSPEAKWAKASAKDNGLRIQKKAKDVAELEQQKSLVFGRGGFFVAHSFVPPEKGAIVSFSINLSLPEPVIFEGTGIVRWVRTHGKSNAPAGFGIEINSLSPELAKAYQQMFGSLTPFIPSPRKMAEGLLAS